MSKITLISLAIKLSCMAVIADLFYIIYRMQEPVKTLADASFVNAVPDMLRLMLLSATVIAGFGMIGTVILRDLERS